MKDPEVLVNLSGGIDSTYLLWKLLSDGKSVLVHNCKITNHEGRVYAEQNAIKKILEWLKENNLSNFKYIQTEFNYGNMERIIRDIEVVYFITAAILRDQKNKSIKELAVSANAHDESNNPKEQSVVRRREILKSISPRKEFEGYDSEAVLSFPIINKTKKDLIDEMPEELFRLTWFCRKPISLDQDNNLLEKNSPNASKWLACKKCTPCKHVMSALIETKV
jgi:7-cyano-7-deazaguanine synthase in queuosine biosynthesis